MALYQYYFRVVPRRQFLKKVGYLPDRVPVEIEDIFFGVEIPECRDEGEEEIGALRN